MDGSGRCSRSGLLLQQVAVDADERAALCEGIKRLASGGRDFGRFTEWVRERVRERGPWDFVLDAANIGFFGQGKEVSRVRRQARAAAAGPVSSGASDAASSSVGEAERRRRGRGGGAVSLEGTSRRVRDTSTRRKAEAHREELLDLQQVDRLLRAIQRIRREGPPPRVLLVLHEKHTTGRPAGSEEAKLLARWSEEGVLLATPRKQNDDLYWLYAAMASGDGCCVVSNDQMRDHSFGMLRPRSFSRWRDRHVVRFCFREWQQEPTLEFPRIFSSIMQFEPASSTWHIPSHESSRWLWAQHGAA